MLGNLISASAGLAAQGTSAYVIDRMIKGIVRMPHDPVKKAAVLAGGYVISACLSGECAKYIQNELNQGMTEIQRIIHRAKPEQEVEVEVVKE